MTDSQTIENKEVSSKKRHKTPKRNNLFMSHGAYAHFFPKHILKAINKSTYVEMMSVFDEIRLTKARLMQVMERREEWEKLYGDEFHANPEHFPYSEMTEETGSAGNKRTTKRIRPDFEGVEDRLVNRLGTLIDLQNRISKSAGLDPQAALRIRADLMKYARIAKWTAVELGTELDIRGIEVPYTLQQRIKAELATIEPPEPSGGITDEEINRLAKESDSAAKFELAWLEKRRQELNDLHSPNHTETDPDV